MIPQRFYSSQQSTVCPITPSDYLSQIESVILAENKACYKPPSVGIGYVNFSLCRPQSTITQCKQKLVRTMSADWLAAWKCVELSLWVPASSILLLIFTGRYTTVSLLSDVNVSSNFYVKLDLRWTWASQKFAWRGKKKNQNPGIETVKSCTFFAFHV